SQRCVTAARPLLLQQHYLRPRLDRPPPLVRLDQIGEAFQQGRLPRPVPPDQRQPIPRPDKQIEPAKQPATPLDEAEIFISEDWCGHGGADRDSTPPRPPPAWRRRALRH